MRLSWLSKGAVAVMMILIVYTPAFAFHLLNTKAPGPSHTILISTRAHAWPLLNEKPRKEVHPLLSANIAPSLQVSSTTLIEYAGTKGTSGGDIIATIYGRGLQHNTQYNLVDNNQTCKDTLSRKTTVTTDMNGRLMLPLFAGPAFYEGSSCRVGTYTVTATAGSSTLMAAYTIKAPQKLPTLVFVAPTAVVLSSTGSFAVGLYGQGLPSNTHFEVAVAVKGPCNIGATGFFNTDAQGNFSMSITGGPDFVSGSPACTAGTYTIQQDIGGTNYLQTLTVETAQP